MSGDTHVTILISFIALLWVAFSGWIILGQRKMIDSLTNKIVRLSAECISVPSIQEDDVSPAREYEPKGWHDH